MLGYVLTGEVKYDRVSIIMQRMMKRMFLRIVEYSSRSGEKISGYEQLDPEQLEESIKTTAVSVKLSLVIVTLYFNNVHISRKQKLNGFGA